MFAGIDWGTRRGWALSALGLTLLGCSGAGHDCEEARACPGPEAPIDISVGDGWWNGGSAGQSESAPAAVEAGSAGAPGEASAGMNDVSDGGALDSTADSTALPPRVLRVTPADGALGVRNDAQLEVVFDRAMNEAATEAAYDSDDLPATQLTFRWNERHDTVTLTPREPLGYASAAASAGLAFPARSYRYGFTSQASDRFGQALSAVRFSFATLREVSLELPAEPERSGNWTDGEGEGIHNCQRHPEAPYVPTVCVGDDANNVRYVGFLSFDLSQLPGNISQFESARLVARALIYGAVASLGASRLEHVSFAELSEAALTTPADEPLGSLLAESALADTSQLELSIDLRAAVASDYANRDARANRSQYRLGFAKVIANGHWDDIEFVTNDIRLSTNYLIP